MNTYRIRYKKGEKGLRTVSSADSVNGFKPSCDSYVFKCTEGEVVAVVPKAVALSVERVDSGEDE